MAQRRPIGQIIAVASAVSLALFGITLFLVQEKSSKTDSSSWRPSAPESKPELILGAKWGDGERFPIGFYKASGQQGDIFDQYFDSFFVIANRVFILDPVKEQISVFEKNKLVRSYPRPSAKSDQDIAVSGDSIYILTLDGLLSRIDIVSGDYKVTKAVIKEGEPGYLIHNALQMYFVQSTLVISTDGYKAYKCYSREDLAEITCPFANIERRHKGVLNLENGYYAAIAPSAVRLYDPNGKVAGALEGISSYRVNLDGAYYLEQSEKEVKIFFKQWQR